LDTNGGVQRKLIPDWGVTIGRLLFHLEHEEIRDWWSAERRRRVPEEEMSKKAWKERREIAKP